jgi:hypothetical protein
VIQERIRDTQAKFEAALKANNFASEADFVAALETYRLAFRTQAFNLALDVLARYEHTLYETRKKLDHGGAAAMASAIAKSQAPQLYAEAQRISTSGGATYEMGDPQRKQAEAEVIRAANDPIVAERGVDREKIAGLDAAGLESYLRSIIAKRQADIASARLEFEDDPGRVFKLPDLIAATKKLQGIEKSTIYNSIVDDYIADERAKHILSAVAMAIVAIALAVLVPGGGWVAAAAMLGSAGLSTYQAFVAYNEYVEESRDYRLHFIQEEPSLFWVYVAVAGAAIDIGLPIATVFADSAKGLKALEGPLQEFARGERTAAELIAKIETAEGLSKEVKAAMEAQLELAKAEESAVKAYQAGQKLYTGGVFDPGLIKNSFRALYYGIRRGVNTIAKLRADRELMKLMGEVTGMSGASRAELEAAFEEIKTLVSAGQTRKMDDATLLGFVDRWAINRGIPGYGERLLDEMRFWRPITAEQQKALTALEEAKSAVAGLHGEKAELLAEREALVAKQRNAATRTEEARERLLEINQRLGELDPSFKQATTKVKVTVVDEAGNQVEKFVDVPVEHPPGEIAKAEAALSKAEKDLAASQLTLYDRLRAAAPSPIARERALKGVLADEVGALLTRPTGKLQADHIVPVREIVDMDGFAELTWQQQKAIVDMKENLIAMDSAANASKGDRSWRSWKAASRFYEQASIDQMIAEEARVRELIRDAIKAKLPAR